MQLHWMGYSGVQPFIGRQLCDMPYCTAAEGVLLSSTSRLACVHMHEAPGDGRVHSPGRAWPLSSAPAQIEPVHAVNQTVATAVTDEQGLQPLGHQSGTPAGRPGSATRASYIQRCRCPPAGLHHSLPGLGLGLCHCSGRSTTDHPHMKRQDKSSVPPAGRSSRRKELAERASRKEQRL